MSFGKSALLALSAISLISSPVMAQAANGPAPRTAATLEDSDAVAGVGILIPLIALVAIVLIAVAVNDSGDDAVSP
ncbi:hypothetical protein KK137_11220 [Croceibacterium sp. LX-88]|uniref:Ferrochelatase n=1 Tax=Croceibacterium selenioxidans TaxID=2838833 RepID=A0ABS5W930_9SPHN|nr:hypothetical protein [Croceibacterium selenioxidans]MBT2134904.1 hypothetical protein [Croceibacterium selenioxidans]